MKRLSLLVFSVLFALAGLNAQTIVLEEDFSGVSDTNTSIAFHLDDNTHVPGWTGNWVYSSTQKVRIGKSSAAGFLMTPALDLSDNNGEFTVTFDAKLWGSDKNSMYVLVVNGTDSVEEVVTGLTSNHFNTYTLAFSCGTAETKIKFKSFQATNARFFLDNIVITSVASGPDTIAPHVSNVHPSANVLTVNFNEDLDQTSAETTANYVLDNNITVTSATLNGHTVSLGVSPDLTEGNTYALTVSNVADVAGNVMLPETYTFTYGVSPEFQVATIAELRNKLDFTDITVNHHDSVEYKLTGEVIVTAIASYNNQKVLQDATGAILVYDPENKLGALNFGDKVKDIYGTLTNYYGFLELQPTEHYGTRVGIYQSVTPLTVTLEQLNDPTFMIQHQAELIKLENVSFTAPGTFAVQHTYEIAQNGVSATAVYPYFQDANTIGSPIPMGTIDIVGFNFATTKIGNTYYDYRYYIVPRSMNDLGTGLPEYLTENDLVVYPNPVGDQLTVTLKTNDFQVTNMMVFDINGKLVFSQPVSDNQIVTNTNGLASGSYFLRLSDGKSSVTTKFVKR